VRLPQQLNSLLSLQERAWVKGVKTLDIVVRGEASE
jgi:hypothetical protein